MIDHLASTSFTTFATSGRPRPKSIFGRGGGKSSASNDANTMRSNARARMVDAISEGEIFGLVDGERSIYFDQTPLQNTDGSYNFKNVIWSMHKGTADEGSFAGHEAVETPTEVNVQVKKATGPVQRTIVDENADALRVIMRIPSLVKQDKKGGLKKTTVQYAIDVRGYNGTWTEVVNNTLSKEKALSPFQVDHEIELPEGGSPWDVRVRRITDDSDDDKLQNDTYWDGYVVLVRGKFTYPFTAAVAMEVNAEDMGSSMPPRAYDVKGIICEVPSNYDAETRAYTGIWDGTFKRSWTDNPAWIFYDLLINDRYGLGEFIKPEIVDKWSLYTIAQYCDQLVPSGFRNADTGEEILEPRFSYNGVINSFDEAFFVLQSISQAWRGMAYWALGQVFATADMPADPVRLVTPANVIGGDFEYAGTALKARHSVVLVQWNDPDDFYRPATEVVIDNDLLNKYGWRSKTVRLRGCTSRGLAHRYGKWIIDTEQHETDTLTYSASWDHAELRPGDIIAVSDPKKAQIRAGGRIAAVNGLEFTLDAPFDYTAGETYQLMATLPSGKVETRAILAFLDAKTVRVASAFSVAPQIDAVWTITGSDIAPRQYRVLGIEEAEANVFKVTALFHDPQKFARIEQGIIFDPLPYERNSKTSLPPTALTVKETGYTANKQTYMSLTVGWTPPQNFLTRGYVVSVDTPNDGRITLGSTDSTYFEMSDTEAGTYTFYVQTVSYAGVLSDPAEITYEAVGIDGFNKPSVVDLELADGTGGDVFSGTDLKVRWTNKLPASTEADDDEDDANETHLAYNTVKVYHGDTDQLLRSEKVSTPLYTYDIVSNRSDCALLGLSKPTRSIKIVVTGTDIYGRTGAATEHTFENTAPAKPLVSAQPGVQLFTLSWTLETDDLDYAGTKVWVSDTAGFDPAATEPVFDGQTGIYLHHANAIRPYYVRVGHYDRFDPDPVNYSDEIVVTPLTADVDTEAPAKPAAPILASDRVTTANGVEQSRIRAIVNPENTEDDLAGYIFQIKAASGNYVGFLTNLPSYEWTSGIQPGVLYFVSVIAFDKAGNKSVPSDETTVLASKDFTLPATPTGFAVVAGTEGFWLTLDANTEADLAFYEFYQADAPEFAPNAASTATYKETSPALYVGGFDPEVSRSFWVRAVDTSGNKSAWAGPQTATTPEGVAITTEALAGLIDETSFAASIAIPGRGTTLPTTPFTAATPTTFYRTTDKTMWVQKTDGTGWIQDSDATLIVGQIQTGQIAASAVGADQIAANAVRAKHMLITDWNNLVPDNQCQDATAWTFGAGWAKAPAASGFSSGRGFQYTYTAGDTGFGPALVSLPFPVKPGGQYFASVQSFSTGTYNFWARLHFFKADGTPSTGGESGGSYKTIISNTFTAGGVRTHSASIDVPSDARTASFAVYCNRSATTDSFQIGTPIVQEKNAATLTVDGTIRSNHLTTDSAVITNSIQIATAIITKAHIVSLSAAQIEGGTALLGTVTVDGRSLSSTANDVVLDDLSATNWALGGGAGLSWASDTPSTGSKYLVINGPGWAYSPDRYPFDPNKLYRITFRVRRPSANPGTSNIYCSLRWYDASQTYFGENHVVRVAWPETNLGTDSWVDLVGFVKGVAPTGINTSVSSIATPATAVTGTAFVTPRIYGQWAGGTGEIHFDSFRMEVVGEDAAAVVNAGSVKIDAGMILVTGSTTLADWRYGGDTTKINGGVIAANTLLVNSAVFGLRALNIEGLEFEHNKPAVNQVSWSAGIIGYTSDSNTAARYTIAAGSATWTAGILYIYYQQASGVLTATTDVNAATGPSKQIIAVYKGGTDLVANYGRTIVDGSGIKAGTVTATQANIASLRTNILTAGVITGTMVQAQTLSARNMVITDGTNLVPDNQILDASSWSVPSTYFYIFAPGTTYNSLNAFRFVSANKTTGYTGYIGSLPFTVKQNTKYRMAGQAQRVSGTKMQGIFRVVWYPTNDGSGALISYNDLPYNTTTPIQFLEQEITSPANARTAKFFYYIQQDNTDGDVNLAGPEVYEKNAASLIVDGSITAIHLDTTSAVITGSAQIASAVIDTAHIKDLSVDTIKVKNGAISNVVTSFSADDVSVSTTETTLQTTVISVAGTVSKVDLTASFNFSASNPSQNKQNNGQVTNITVRVYRNEVEIYSFTTLHYWLNANEYAYVSVMGNSVYSFNYTDTEPLAGTNTYTMSIIHDRRTFAWSNRYLRAMEIKK